MPTVTSGADPDALDALAARLDKGATTIEGVYTPVRQSLHGSGWVGQDADRFANDWNGPSKTRLAQCATALRDAATTLRKNAQAQRVTSNDYDGSLGVWNEHRLYLPIIRLTDPNQPPIWTSDGGIADKLASGGATFRPGSLAGGVAAIALGGGLAAGASGAWSKGWDGSTKVDGSLGPVKASAHAEGEAGVSASGSASATLGRDGASASAGGEVFAGVKGSAGADVSMGPAYGHAEVQAEVGAEAAAKGNAHIGLDGAAVGASGSAFVGGKLSGELSGGISGVSETATGGVSYGVGVSGSASAAVGRHNIELKLSGNAALGLGLNGSIDLKVDPTRLATDGAHALASGAKEATKLISEIPHPHWW